VNEAVQALPSTAKGGSLPLSSSTQFIN